MSKSWRKILIASNNQGKINEISALLKQINIEAIAPKDLTIFENLIEPEETGKNFQENSLIKAKYYAQKSGFVALADDSGLCVSDLNNKPGIHSARFALNDKGEKDFPHAFNKIFAELSQKNINLESKPQAYFICNLTLFDPINQFCQSFEGRVNGTLTYPKGDKGFGYDPIFIKNNMTKTFGEIDPQEKDKISHRGQAFKQLTDWLKSNN